MKGIRNPYRLIILLIALPVALTNAGTERYKFRHIRADDGLPAPSVYSVVKDHQGFIWLATGIGLYRYDGNNFTAYRSNPNDATTLSSNLLTAHLFVDRAGHLWAGTADNGLNRVNTSTGLVTRYQADTMNPHSLSHHQVHRILQDEYGNIWIATFGGGLNKLLNEGNSFAAFWPIPDNPSHNANYIKSFIEIDERTLLVGTRQGLYYFDKPAGSFTCYASRERQGDFLKEEIITDILKDKHLLWIGTENGLVKVDPVARQITRYHSDKNDPSSLSSNMITQIVESPDGYSLWISTVWGLNKFDKETGTSRQFLYSSKDPKSLGYNMVWSLYTDSCNILWIGTDNAGLNKLNLNTNPFRHHKIEGQQAQEGQFSATAFCEDKNGDFWIGTFEGGLWQFDKELQFKKRYVNRPDDPNSLAGNSVFSLCTDPDNALWVGTSGGGVNKISGNTITRLHTNLINPTNPMSSVIEIVADQEERIWIGSLNGLFYSDRATGKEIINLAVKPLGDALIRAICEDRNGNLWIGTQNKGLFKLAKKVRGTYRFQNYLNVPGDPGSISCNIVMSVYEDHSGDIWIATIQGLNKYQPLHDNFRSYDSHSGLEADYLYYIQGGENGILWITSSRGLIRFNPLPDSGQMSKLYDLKSDVPIEEIYPYSFYLCKNGKVYIGGKSGSDYGYYTFYTDSLKDNTMIPPIAITRILIRDEPLQTDSLVSVKKRLLLKHHQNFLSFEFAALDYIDPGKNQYACYFEGLDEDWQSVGNRTFTNYTGIPPGDYIFRVKGSNNDGYWNEAGTSIAITVLPPPWKTWWASVLYALLLTGLLLSWRFYDLKRQRLKQELELEHVETEKLKSLDSVKSRFYANISHEFRTPLTLILGQIDRLRPMVQELELSEDLNIMQRSAKRLHNLIDQLLNLSKLESGQMKLHTRRENIVLLINGYLQSFESLAQKKEIDLIFDPAEETILLYVDRDKIEKILYNLLSNAFKFTGKGGRIEVGVGTRACPLKDNEIMAFITVSDTGCGIPHEQLPRIFDRFFQADNSPAGEKEGTGIGLALARELVDLHHGTIAAESKLGEGTTFSVFLPVGSRHLGPDEMTDDHGLSTATYKPLESASGVSLTCNESTMEGHPGMAEVDGKEDKPLLLVLEDHADLRTYIIKTLEKDYCVAEARNGEEGYATAREKIPDLIVSDVMMPVMDGYQFCRKLKADERTCHIPVILLTARADMEDKLEGLETGADDFLTKPFSPLELLVRIKNLINQRQRLKEKYKSRYVFAGEKDQDEMLSSDERFLQKAGEFIRQNLADPELSVESFSGFMAMSQSQLYRKLKALVDLSPNEMIRTLRLNRAAELLAHHTGNIAEIAYEVGFNNPSYFSECFRKQFGTLPSEYTG